MCSGMQQYKSIETIFLFSGNSEVLAETSENYQETSAAGGISMTLYKNRSGEKEMKDIKQCINRIRVSLMTDSKFADATTISGGTNG